MSKEKWEVGMRFSTLLVITAFAISFLLGSFDVLAMARKVETEESTVGSTEVLEAKTVAKDSVEADSAQAKEEEYRSKEEIEKEMIEENRKIYLPFVPEHVKFLEQNYKCTLSLELYMWDLEKALDLQALPVLIKILLYNPRGINRAMAAQAIEMIEAYNKDDEAILALAEALNDSITDVQFNAAKALVNLGDTLHSIPVLTMLARGIDKENWSVDWAGYIGLENVTEEELEQQKKRFRDGLQYKAIDLLGKLSTKEAILVLQDITEHHKEQAVQEYAKKVMEKNKSDKEIEKKREER